MNFRILYFLLFIMLVPLIGICQSKYFTREGHIHFKSEGKVELIESNNYKVTSIVDFQTGNIEVAVLMKAFEFNKALMEEHFNENYIESDDFPKSTFKGKIKNVDSVSIDKDGVYEVEMEGDLALHGVTKSIIVPATLTMENGILRGRSIFTVKVEDYNIKIPKVVADNIAKEIVITIHFNYKPFER